MAAATLPLQSMQSKWREEEGDSFRYALAVAFLLEVGGLSALVFGSATPAKPIPKKEVIAVRLVTLPAPPKPQAHSKPMPVPPKPVIHPQPIPQPIPHPAPRPQPRPRPHPVRKTAPTPLFAKTPAPQAPVFTPPLTSSKTVPPSPSLPPTPSPQEAASASPQEATSAMDRYVGILRPIIQEHLRVPEELRAMAISGNAIVDFRLTPSGHVLWARVVRPSGIGAVNRAALAAVRAGNYPPFLKHMPHQDKTFEIDVHVSGRGQ